MALGIVGAILAGVGATVKFGIEYYDKRRQEEDARLREEKERAELTRAVFATVPTFANEIAEKACYALGLANLVDWPAVAAWESLNAEIGSLGKSIDDYRQDRFAALQVRTGTQEDAARQKLTALREAKGRLIVALGTLVRSFNDPKSDPAKNLRVGNALLLDALVASSRLSQTNSRPSCDPDGVVGQRAAVVLPSIIEQYAGQPQADGEKVASIAAEGADAVFNEDARPRIAPAAGPGTFPAVNPGMGPGIIVPGDGTIFPGTGVVGDGHAVEQPTDKIIVISDAFREQFQTLLVRSPD